MVEWYRIWGGGSTVSNHKEYIICMLYDPKNLMHICIRMIYINHANISVLCEHDIVFYSYDYTV